VTSGSALASGTSSGRISSALLENAFRITCPEIVVQITSTPTWQPLACLTVRDVSWSHNTAGDAVEIELVLDHLQLDDQSPRGAVIFVPIRRLGTQGLPLLHLAASRHGGGADVTRWPYVSASLQPFELELHEQWLLAVMQLVDNLSREASEEQKVAHKAMDTDWVGVPKPSYLPAKVWQGDGTENQAVYLELLHLHPAQFFVTFMGTGNLLSQRSGGLWLPMHILESVWSSLHDTSLSFNALVLEHTFIPSDQLATRFVAVYKTRLLKQLPKILGSADALGDPVGLIRNCSKGFTDFFYEPAEGIVRSPKDFAKGVKKGTVSLVSHTLGGALGSGSKVLGAVSKGFEAASLDKEYARNRANERREVTGVASGVATGVKGFGKGVFGGLVGLVEKPVKGAAEGGAKGFFKGVGKGITGVVTKPIAGTVSLAQGVVGGIGKEVANQSRPPKAHRLYPPGSGALRGPPRLSRESRAADSWTSGPVLEASVYLESRLPGQHHTRRDKLWLELSDRSMGGPTKLELEWRERPGAASKGRASLSGATLSAPKKQRGGSGCSLKIRGDVCGKIVMTFESREATEEWRRVLGSSLRHK